MFSSSSSSFLTFPFNTFCVVNFFLFSLTLWNISSFNCNLVSAFDIETKDQVNWNPLPSNIQSIYTSSCPFNSATLWKTWVTNSSTVSYWDNREQVREEVKERKGDDKHPLASETRFVLSSKQILNAPSGWSFVMIEIGQPNYCPEQCEPTLFGIVPQDDCSAKLISYNVYTDVITNFIQCIYYSNEKTKCTLQYDDLQPNGIVIPYKYIYNDNAKEQVFYGEGGGTTSSGDKIYVKETIAPDFVAPLELFYDQSGKCLTPYTTPLIYHVYKTKDEL